MEENQSEAAVETRPAGSNRRGVAPCCCMARKRALILCNYFAIRTLQGPNGVEEDWSGEGDSEFFLEG